MEILIYGGLALVVLLIGLWGYTQLLRARLEDAETERDYADAQLAALHKVRAGEAPRGIEQ